MNRGVNVRLVVPPIVLFLILVGAPAVLWGWRLQQMLVYLWALAGVGAVGLFLVLRPRRVALLVMLTLLVFLGGMGLLMRRLGVW